MAERTDLREALNALTDETVEIKLETIEPKGEVRTLTDPSAFTMRISEGYPIRTRDDKVVFEMVEGETYVAVSLFGAFEGVAVRHKTTSIEEGAPDHYWSIEGKHTVGIVKWCSVEDCFVCGSAYNRNILTTMEDQMRKSKETRLPMDGRVHLGVDGDTIVITVPASKTPGETTERCDKVARMLFEAPNVGHVDFNERRPLHEYTIEELVSFYDKFKDAPSFYMEIGEEVEFAAKQLKDHLWEKVVIVNHVTDKMPHTWDTPGPFLFSIRHNGPFLTLRVMRAER